MCPAWRELGTRWLRNSDRPRVLVRGVAPARGGIGHYSIAPVQSQEFAPYCTHPCRPFVRQTMLYLTPNRLFPSGTKGVVLTCGVAVTRLFGSYGELSLFVCGWAS